MRETIQWARGEMTRQQTTVQNPYTANERARITLQTEDELWYSGRTGKPDTILRYILKR